MMRRRVASTITGERLKDRKYATWRLRGQTSASETYNTTQRMYQRVFMHFSVFTHTVFTTLTLGISISVLILTHGCKYFGYDGVLVACISFNKTTTRTKRTTRLSSGGLIKLKIFKQTFSETRIY